VSDKATDRDRIAFLHTLLAVYRRLRAVDGLNGRDWDGHQHLKAEDEIEQLERQYTEDYWTFPLRCEGRYSVPGTSPPREEPFEVTYRCGLKAGHEGPHGP